MVKVKISSKIVQCNPSNHANRIEDKILSPKYVTIKYVVLKRHWKEIKDFLGVIKTILIYLKPYFL